MFTIWSQQNIPELNSVGYVNDKVEKLFDEAGGTYDTAVRKEKYIENCYQLSHEPEVLSCLQDLAGAFEHPLSRQQVLDRMKSKASLSRYEQGSLGSF